MYTLKEEPMNLTDKQQKVLDFIRDFVRSNGQSPTLREIGDALQCTFAMARKYVLALQERGALSVRPGYRGIELPDIRTAPCIAIPVAGRISAGQPVLAAENIEDHIVVDTALFSNKDAFSLRVKGDSMIGAGIFDGDYVIVRPQKSVDNGTIGVVRVGDEATVKRIRVKGATIELKPENPKLHPMIYPLSDVEIVGKVVGVIRKI